MTPEAQRIAIAEACGWEVLHQKLGRRSTTVEERLMGRKPTVTDWLVLPNYLSDLNAMHDAEKVLSRIPEACHYSDYERYCQQLDKLPEPHSATAAQRAEVFLRTLNLWKD